MTKLVHPPRRRGYRRRVHIPYGEVVRESDFRVVSSLTLDLSPFGAMVRADKAVLTGEEVIFSLRPARRDLWVDVFATVTRVIHGRREADVMGHCLGLSFHGLDAATSRALYASMAAPETRLLPPSRRS